jgi:hypothetical protein
MRSVVFFCHLEIVEQKESNSAVGTLFRLFWQIFVRRHYIGQQPIAGQSLLIGAPRSHSVVLLWTSDQPDTDIYTWQHPTQQTASHAPGRIRTRNPSKRAARDLRFSQRSHLDRHKKSQKICGDLVAVQAQFTVNTVRGGYTGETFRYRTVYLDRNSLSPNACLVAVRSGRQIVTI